MNGIFLLLGTNLGNRLQNLQEAAKYLLQNNILVMDESSIYETQPWGKEKQSWFFNIILQIETSLSPTNLLKCLLSIEESMGRVRKEKWGERIIDIDILYYHDQIVRSESLMLPHPGIPERKFTLIPLVEMQPLEKHPELKKTQTELLAKCTDPLDCRITDYKL